jgi:hypothetical protein
MAEIRFYALREDILRVLEAVENKSPIKYVRAGRFLSPQLETFLQAADIPDIGKADTESGVTCETFLICDPALRISLEVVNQHDGVRSFHVNQLWNPDTITFTPAGLWTENILLYGRFATVSATVSNYAKRMMNRLRYQVGRQFTRIQGDHVGPMALEFLKAGKRLTIAEQTPRKYDLSLSDAQ